MRFAVDFDMDVSKCFRHKKRKKDNKKKNKFYLANNDSAIIEIIFVIIFKERKHIEAKIFKKILKNFKFFPFKMH